MRQNEILNRGDLVKAFAAYKLIVLAIAFLGLTTFAQIWPDSPTHFISLFFQWDAKHILRVARDGYLAQEPSIQVMPLYPLCIRAVHFFIGSWEWSAWLLAQAFSLIALAFLYKLALDELEPREAAVAVAAFALFPTAYFLSLPYTEAPFCATSFAAIYFVRSRKYTWAAVAAFLAMLTRFNGIFLAPSVVAHAYFSRKQLERRDLIGLAAIAAAVTTGFLAYLAQNYALYGNPFYYIANQAKHWGVHTSYPFSGAIAALKAFSTRGPADRTSIIGVELAFTFAAVAIFATRLFDREYARRHALDLTYMGLNLLVLVSLDFWLSRPRYVLPLYPIYFWLGPRLSRGSPFRQPLYLLGSVSIFALYLALYLNARWAH